MVNDEATQNSEKVWIQIYGSVLGLEPNSAHPHPLSCMFIMYEGGITMQIVDR